MIRAIVHFDISDEDFSEAENQALQLDADSVTLPTFGKPEIVDHCYAVYKPTSKNVHRLEEELEEFCNFSFFSVHYIYSK